MNASALSSPPSSSSAPDQGLDHVADDIVALARAILARLLAELDQRRKAKLAADLGAGLARDEDVEAARELSLGLLAEALVEPARDDQADDPVAEELQPLVAVACRRCAWVSARSNRARSSGSWPSVSRRNASTSLTAFWPLKPVAIRSAAQGR